MTPGCPFCGEATPEYAQGKTEAELAAIIRRHIAVCTAFSSHVLVIGP